MSPVFVVPPDNRTPGSGNPPQDVNELSDMEGLLAQVLAQMAGFPGSNSIPADNAANVTAVQSLGSGGYSGPGLAPSGDTTGTTDQANITAYLNFISPGGTAFFQGGTFWTTGPVIHPPWITAQGNGVVLNNSFLSDYPTVFKPTSGWAQGRPQCPQRG